MATLTGGNATTVVDRLLKPESNMHMGEEKDVSIPKVLASVTFCYEQSPS
jgi:hypothetical protein